MDDFTVVDEVHEHATRDVFQMLNTATGARRQPLIFEITTAGRDRHSVCRQHHAFRNAGVLIPAVFALEANVQRVQSLRG